MNSEEVKVAAGKAKEAFELSQPTYEEDLETAREVVGWPGNALEGEDALKFISLVCGLTKLYRVKDEKVKPIHIISKACGKAMTVFELKRYRQMSVMCELFMTSIAEFSTHGLTTAPEMFAEINRLMDLWLPF